MKLLCIYLFVSFLLFTMGCRKNNQPTINQVVDLKVQYTADTFNSYYLWYETMPAVDLTTFTTPASYIDKVRNSLDRWSFAMSYTALMDLLQNGTTTGWGVGLGYDSSNLLRIYYVYDKSAMGRAGVRRGWQIKSINGRLVSGMTTTEVNTAIGNTTNTFGFIKNDGSEVSAQLTKGTIAINSVQYSTIINKGSRKIGYFVFSDFLGSSVNELNTIFDNFSAQGISDMVIDLRYNGGGTLDCADSLVAMVAGNPYKDKVYNTLTYNNKHTRLGYTSTIGLKRNSVKLDKLVFITTSSTASASELVISGLKPYLNVKLIGSKTHGKPVGMNIEGNTSLDLAVAPISFRNTNSVGYTDFFNGIPVDFAASDVVSLDWGDAADPCLNAAINFISTGTVGIVTAKSASDSTGILYKGSDHPIENQFLKM